VWKVDPLPLSVPLRLAVALADAVLVDVLVLVVVGELDEEHAARATAQIASPAVVPAVYVEGAYRVLLTGFIGLGCREQPGRPANRGVRVQFVGAAGTCGQIGDGQK
jgi:hypothetical protein